MDFVQTIERVQKGLNGANVRYALIGGFAMALRGVQRSTVDVDFVLMLEDLERAEAVLQNLGYHQVFKSKDASSYFSNNDLLGRIDLLHAFRGPTLSMIKRADSIEVTDDLSLPVVYVEDLIGLKIQAIANDPKRLEQDWLDIRLMLEAAGSNSTKIDWTLVQEYLDLFGEGAKLKQLKVFYGQADRE